MTIQIDPGQVRNVADSLRTVITPADVRPSGSSGADMIDSGLEELCDDFTVFVKKLGDRMGEIGTTAENTVNDMAKVEESIKGVVDKFMGGLIGITPEPGRAYKLRGSRVDPTGDYVPIMPTEPEATPEPVGAGAGKNRIM